MAFGWIIVILVQIALRGSEGFLDAERTEACRSIFSCYDCRSASICSHDGNGGFKREFVVPCNDRTPYCDFETGTCSSSPHSSCGKDESFYCTENGRFPDGDCRVYHECDGYKSVRYECNALGQVYDADERRCVDGEGCGQFECTGSDVIVAHSRFPSYFASCEDNEPKYIYRCPGSYELIDSVCRPRCHKEGAMQDLNDCNKFFSCQIQNGSLALYHLDCPSMMGFDPNSLICVNLPSDDLPNCVARRSTGPIEPRQRRGKSIKIDSRVKVVLPHKENNFQCLSDGIFPDNDCTSFHICSGLTPTTYKCEGGLKFNLNHFRCERHAKCGNFNCKDPGNKVAHSIYRGYYAYCAGGDTMIIGRCNGKYELNVTSQNCEPICRRAGLIQDLDDCTGYFECQEISLSPSTTAIVKRKRSCPSGTVYDPTISICVNSDSISLTNCKPTSNVKNETLSDCIKQLPKHCRNGKGLKDDCIFHYLTVASLPGCSTEVKQLINALINHH